MSLKKKTLILFSIIAVALIVAVSVILISLKDNPKRDDTQANMDFVINDTLADGNNQKVKVFILGGQSNASGVASEEELKKNISNDKYLEYKEGYSKVYINYYNDNGNNKSLGFTNVKLGQGYNKDYFGPELGMGEKLHELYPKETIFIIKYAWGGSNLHTQWDSEYGNIYKAFVKFVKESMEYLENKNYDAEIMAMMWMQGESDSSKKDALNYYDNLLNMMSSIREEFKEDINKEGMYFVDAYIASSPIWPYHNVVNEAKKNVCDLSDLNLCIDTNGEGLSTDKEPAGNPDLAHYDSLSELKLGHLFIEKYISKE